MMRRTVASIRALLLATVLAAAMAGGAGAQVQQGSVIDDLLKRAQDAYNDLNFLRADTLANQVLGSTGRISTAQRTRAMMIVAASAYPDDPSAQRRALALTTLRRLVAMNLDVAMPTELRWAGLDSVIDEAKRTAFGLAVTADTTQALVGPTGMGKVAVRSNRTGRFSMRIFQGTAGTGVPVAVDSAIPGATAELRFAGMRNERPVFASGDYMIVVTGIDATGRDTVTHRIGVRVEAPALEFVQVPTKMDSTKLLPVRSPRYGLKAILPALIAGGGAFALASVVRGDGDIKTEVKADSKGFAVAGAIIGGTIFAGMTDRGRPLPANVAANKASGEAFNKSIADANAENRRRVVEHRTTIRMSEGGQ